MSSVTYAATDEHADEGFEPYRALSKSAVCSAVLGFLSFLALMMPELVILPLAGVVLGCISFVKIRRYPAELSGKFPALMGAILNGALLISSVTFHSVTYATEVPEGYQRVGFLNLQPVPEHPELPVSPTALELNGKKIFIKGYVYPDGQQGNIKRFVLVPDMGTCCFGGQPKLTHMVEVTLTDPHRIKYSRLKRKLAGELKVVTMLKPVSGLNGVYFQLQADYVQ